MSKRISFTNAEIENLDTFLELVIAEENKMIKSELDYDRKQFLYEDIKKWEGIRSKLKGKQYKYRKEIGVDRFL